MLTLFLSPSPSPSLIPRTKRSPRNRRSCRRRSWESWTDWVWLSWSSWWTDLTWWRCTTSLLRTQNYSYTSRFAVDVRVSMLAGEEFCDFRERENCIGGEKISGVFENSLPYFYLPYCEGPTSESFPAVYTFNKTAFLWIYSLYYLLILYCSNIGGCVL